MINFLKYCKTSLNKQSKKKYNVEIAEQTILTKKRTSATTYSATTYSATTRCLEKRYSMAFWEIAGYVFKKACEKGLTWLTAAGAGYGIGELLDGTEENRVIHNVTIIEKSTPIENETSPVLYAVIAILFIILAIIITIIFCVFRMFKNLNFIFTRKQAIEDIPMTEVRTTKATIQPESSRNIVKENV